MGFVHNMDPVD